MLHGILLRRRELLRELGLAGVGGLVAGTGLLGGTRPAAAQEEEPDPSGRTVDKITEEELALPEPSGNSSFSVERSIASRRSRRKYEEGHLTIGQLGQLLWAAQGITGELRQGSWSKKLRAAPSAGALYPMELWAVLPAGVYRYRPEEHAITRALSGSRAEALRRASLDQDMITGASVNFLITAVYERCSLKYGKRATRYCMMEAGCIAENLHLQAESLNLSTVVIGAFQDEKVREALSLESSYRPMIVMPVGLRQ